MLDIYYSVPTAVGGGQPLRFSRLDPNMEATSSVNNNLQCRQCQVGFVSEQERWMHESLFCLRVEPCSLPVADASWSETQDRELLNAYRTVSVRSNTFWRDVSARVHHKTSRQCQQRFETRFPTPDTPLRKRRRRPQSPAALCNLPAVGQAPLKRRRMLRQLLHRADRKEGEDYFENEQSRTLPQLSMVPVTKAQPQLNAFDSSREIRRQARFVSPRRALAPLDRNTLDAYVRSMKNRFKR